MQGSHREAPGLVKSHRDGSEVGTRVFIVFSSEANRQGVVGRFGVS